MTRPFLRLTVVVLSTIAVGAWCIADVWPFFSDDAFISLRVADRLVAGDGLTWTDGERVEAYSNLAWVLACALLGAVGLPAPTAARVLGIACVATALVLIAARFRTSLAAWIAVAVAATTACAPWTIAGLELPLLLACTTGGLLAFERALADASPRSALTSGALFALAALTRPDAPLTAVVLGAALFLTTRARAGPVRAMHQAVRFVSPVALVMAAQQVFRVAYYGDWIANTARVKIGGGYGPFGEGLAYVGSALIGMCGLSVLALTAASLLPFDRDRRAFAMTLVACVVAWGGYLVVIGGDFFPAYRLAVPLIPPLALLGGLGVEGALARGWNVRLVALLVVAALVANRTQAAFHPETARAANETWEWDGVAVGSALRDALAGRDPLLAVDAAGAVPWASRLRCVDMYGLCDATIAREPGRAAQDSAFTRAHRRGSPAYLLARAPDLFLFGPSPGSIVPLDAPGLALVDDPAFVAEYRVVWLLAREEPSLLAPLWVRLHGRCGVTESPREIDLAPWLLGAARMSPGLRATAPTDVAGIAEWQRRLAPMLPWLEQTTVARVANGALQVELRRSGDYSCDGLTLASGVWEVVVEPRIPGIEIAVIDASGAALTKRDGLWQVPSTATDLRLACHVSEDAVPAVLDAIRLRRRGPDGR